MGQKPLALAAPRRTSHFAAWFAMLALAIQCLVVQPHVDAAFAPVSVETAHVLQTAQPAPDSSQAVCVICQAMATTGAFALASSPPLVLIERNFVANAPIHRAEPAQRQRSHNWQSRAPPQTI